MSLDLTAADLASLLSAPGRVWTVEGLRGDFAFQYNPEGAVCRLSSRVALIVAHRDDVLYLATVIDGERTDTAKEVYDYDVKAALEVCERLAFIYMSPANRGAYRLAA